MTHGEDTEKPGRSKESKIHGSMDDEPAVSANPKSTIHGTAEEEPTRQTWSFGEELGDKSRETLEMNSAAAAVSGCTSVAGVAAHCEAASMGSCLRLSG